MGLFTPTEEYYGWKNYESWAAHLILFNDQATVAWLMTELNYILGDVDTDDTIDRLTVLATERLAGIVKDWLATEPTVAAEIGSLWRVEWHAVFEEFVREALADAGY